MSNLYFYDKDKYNFIYDVLEIETCINPTFEIDKKFKRFFQIDKILLAMKDGIIKECFLINGNHYKIKPETRMFYSDDILNKNIGEDFKKKSITETIKESLFDNYKKFFLFYNFLTKNIKIKKIGNSEFIFYDRKLFNMNFDIFELQKQIIPNKIVKRSKLSTITYIPQNFIINNVKIFTIKQKIFLIQIDSAHPNCNIIDRRYCMPPYLYTQNIYNIGNNIEIFLEVFDMSNPHFYIPTKIKYSRE